jgi:hypothetical protein
MKMNGKLYERQIEWKATGMNGKLYERQLV